MNKYFVVILIALGLASCHKKNEHYYMTHSKELQSAMKACPNKQPQGLTCEQVDQIGNRMNELGRELQSNPQAFGNKIMKLQETIAQQKLELKANNTNSDLKLSLEKNQHVLVEFLAVVKWLESPEG